MMPGALQALGRARQSLGGGACPTCLHRVGCACGGSPEGCPRRLPQKVACFEMPHLVLMPVLQNTLNRKQHEWSSHIAYGSDKFGTYRKVFQ